MTSINLFHQKKAIVIDEITKSLTAINPTSVKKYLEAIEKAEKVFFVGVGRVLLSLKAICKRYAHLGIHTVVVGDITEPAITDKDVLVVGSGSGETTFPLEIAKKAKKIGATVIHVGSNPEGRISNYTNIFVRIPVESKSKYPDEIQSSQPMTSLFEQSLLLFGDITSMMIVEKKDISLPDLWQYHANLE